MLQGLRERLFNLPSELKKSLLLLAAYGAWILVFRLIWLSVVVYFLTRQGRISNFEEINESFTNNEIVFAGLSSALFFALLKGLSPILGRESELEFSARKLRTQYLPGFLQGLLLAGSVVVGFLLVGSYRFVGFFVQIEDTPVALLGIVCRISAFLAIGLCEETLFRSEGLSSALRPARILFLALFYAVVKLAQFDLGWMHFASLFLFSVTLSIRRSGDSSFFSGAGFWSAIFIVFHPLFSLPVFGSDFSGIFLLKYQTQSTLPALISGGAGGPLSSVAFQAVLLIETVRGSLIHKKSLLKPIASL